MKTKNIITILLLAGIILCMVTGTVSARYATAAGDNAGINLSDTVYRGEKNLNFSAYSSGGSTVDYLQHVTDGSQISLINQIASIGETQTPGTYGAWNNSVGRLGFTVCTIAELNLGKISVTPYATTVTDTNPASISKAAEVVFYISGSNLHPDQLNGNWNGFTITNRQTGIQIQSIKNIGGNTQSLIGVTDPTDKTNGTYAFKLVDQSPIPAADSTPVTISFNIDLNSIPKDKTRIQYSFTAVQSTFDLTGARIAAGNTGTAVLTGVPFTAYTVALSTTGSDTPYFNPAEGVVLIDTHTVIATPGWNGTVPLPITVPANTPAGNYPITASGSGTVKSASITVNAAVISLVFDAPSSDAVSGLFAEGDFIKLAGTVKGAQSNVDIYFYITGPNLPQNGVSLTGTPVVDGDPSTFTIFTYSIVLNLWEGGWITSGFEPGTYTIHANLKPCGYLESSTPNGKGYSSDISHDYVISDQSIHAKSDETNSGYFAQGDYLRYNISARGSPGTKGGMYGDIRWYIIGSNFRYADMKAKYLLVEDPTLFGIVAPQGTTSFEYNRSFSYNLDPGTYYLILQHPGPDAVFDVTPDITGGSFSIISTAWGSSANLGTQLSDNAAYTLTNAISDAKSDDLYVITEFTIEKPRIEITQLGNTPIGTTITIQGTTNYYTDDTFSLKIQRLDFENPDNNIAMLIPTERIQPSSVSPYAKYMSRPFSFGEIDTSTWFPGTYEAKVTNIDTGVTTAMTFTVGGESEVDSTVIGETYDPALTTQQTPEPVQTNLPVSTPVPAQTKSPGFIYAVPAFLAGLVFYMRRQ
ncbi:hypothetical protein SDC9_17360 [bioreactor metagenome]|uniref:Uncharacterized protein n=1 Tax=bioreactor metagenome TaxID=1076179 RepID=A0A644TX90_9ZZZZ|nr:hypothetical protein [Methanocorpusculum sp.]